MDKNRKLKRLVPIVIIIALFIAAVYGIAIYKRSKSNNVKEEIDTTTIYANLDKFDMNVEEASISYLGTQYMKFSKFEILEWDEDTMKGKVKLSVPDAYDEMVKTLEEFNIEYNSIIKAEDSTSLDLKNVLIERLAYTIENTDKIREEEISVDLTEHDKKVYIVPSQDVFNYIYEDFLRINIENQANLLGGESYAEN